MLYYVQHLHLKTSHSAANLAFHTTFSAKYESYRGIEPFLLYKIQHSSINAHTLEQLLYFVQHNRLSSRQL